MSESLSFVADALFILFICGVIYFFVYWFGPIRKSRLDKDKGSTDEES